MLAPLGQILYCVFLIQVGRLVFNHGIASFEKEMLTVKPESFSPTLLTKFESDPHFIVKSGVVPVVSAVAQGFGSIPQGLGFDSPPDERPEVMKWGRDWCCRASSPRGLGCAVGSV